jgi:hypothetical protein
MGENPIFDAAAKWLDERSALTDGDRAVKERAQQWQREAKTDEDEFNSSRIIDTIHELARVREQLKQKGAALIGMGKVADQERAARDKAEAERDRWRQAAKSRLDGSVIARAEQAEARLAELRGEGAVERAAKARYENEARGDGLYPYPPPWEDLVGDDREPWLGEARTVLEAALLERGEDNEKGDN